MSSMNDATLNYRVDGDYEYLEGIWKGCGLGKIALRRKTVAAGGNAVAVRNPVEPLEYGEMNGVGFDFPKAWKWDKGADMITVTSTDDNIVMFVIKTATADINEAAALARKSIDVVAKDVDLPDAFSETQRNGLTIQTIDGNANLKQGDTPVFVSSLLIQSPANQNFTVYLGIGEKNSILQNQDTMAAALDSFKPAVN